MDFSFSKEQFIEWTTEGYPMPLSGQLTKNALLDSLVEFVNINDNQFHAELYHDSVNIHMADDEIIMTVVYKDDKVVMLTDINNQEIDEESFQLLTRQKILGQACLGVITFCQTISSFFGVEKVAETYTKKESKNKKGQIEYAWLL